MEFLAAMADQAAIAVDYATLLRHTRDGARREERQRLARDLHDSIVQQVFSISMQAKSMEVLARRGDAVPAAAVLRIAGEVGDLSGTVLADLRAMVHELRLSASADLGGLEEAVRALTESTANRTGLKFSVSAGRGLDAGQGRAGRGRLPDRRRGDPQRRQARGGGQGDDPAEPARRPADGDRRGRRPGHGDGRGPVSGTRRRATRPPGYGLTTMRERAERWGGTVTVGPGRTRPAPSVRLAVPLTGGMPLAPRGGRARRGAR